jgi:hypothetical protein
MSAKAKRKIDAIREKIKLFRQAWGSRDPENRPELTQIGG